MPENDVLWIQPMGFGSAQEKLWPVGIGTSIGHWEDTRTCMFQFEVFIGKLKIVLESIAVYHFTFSP